MNSKKPVTAKPVEVLVISRSRKAYQAPKLIEYGSIAKLTATGGFTLTDGMASMSMSCL